MKFKKHLFICTHKRDEGESCGAKDSDQLVDQLKKWVKAEKPEAVKVTRSGCLGLCEDGIVSVCYPEGDWTTKLTLNDIDIIKSKLIK